MKARHRVRRTKPSTQAFQRTTRRSSRLARWLVPPVIVASLVTAFGACGNGKPSDVVETESIAECDAYADAYARCVAPLAGRAELAQSLSASTRAGLNAGPSTPEARERRRERCADASKNLVASCPAAAGPTAALAAQEK